MTQRSKGAEKPSGSDSRRSTSSGDLLSRMRSTSIREGSSSQQTPEEEPPIQERDATETEQPKQPKASPKPVRFTLDLPRSQHKFLKRFALDADSDAAPIVRVLISRLERDEELARSVREELQE